MALRRNCAVCPFLSLLLLPFEVHRAFLEGSLEPIEEAIEEQGWSALEEACDDGIIGSQMYHVKNERPYIMPKLPDYPPPDLQMNPSGS